MELVALIEATVRRRRERQQYTTVSTGVCVCWCKGVCVWLLEGDRATTSERNVTKEESAEQSLICLGLSGVQGRE